MSLERPALYLVATPVGNLADLSPRAISVLRDAERILCEDTRTTRRLTAHFQIGTRLVALHEHNETESAPYLVAEILDARAAYALVSDAGTPAISDPGYRIVRAAHEAGVPVFSVPGPCAAVAGLAASGLATDRFVFEGFLPPKQSARRAHLESLLHEPRTLVFYESCHRIAETLSDLCEVFGPGRPAAIARELSKLHEQTLSATVGELVAGLASGRIPVKGEFVLLVAGGPPADATAEAQRLLIALTPHLPLRTAAKVAASLTGLRANALYAMAEALRDAD